MTSVHPNPPRHRRAVAPLAIALVGARGAAVAAEVAPRLERAGHRVVVAERVPVRAARVDAAILFGTALAPLIPLVRASGAAVAVHVEGPGGSTGRGLGRVAHRFAERRAVRGADALIVGCRGMQDHIAEEFGVVAELIPVGATVLTHVPADLIEAEGLVPGLFHVATVPASTERLDLLVEGFRRSCARLPLVLVADGRAADTARQLAGGDDRIRVLSGTDRRLRDQLVGHALSSLHPEAAGGAGCALADAMGAGTAVIAWDVVFNRETAGTAGLFFGDAAALAARVEEVERFPFRFRDIGELMQERARSRHDWDAVAERYAALAARLAGGETTRGAIALRRPDSPWAGHPSTSRTRSTRSPG